jgi:hypothetical protein
VTTDRLAQVRELLGRATPGPWGYKAGVLKHYVFSTDPREELGFSLQEMHWRDGQDTKAEHNAPLIAALRNIAPDLLAAVEAAEEVIQAHDQQTGPVSIYLRAKVVRLREALGRLRAGT